jgi:hypothetical protein
MGTVTSATITIYPKATAGNVYKIYRLTGSIDGATTWNSKPQLDPTTWVSFTAPTYPASLPPINVISLLAKNGNLPTFGVAVLLDSGSGGDNFFSTAYGTNWPADGTQNKLTTEFYADFPVASYHGTGEPLSDLPTMAAAGTTHVIAYFSYWDIPTWQEGIHLKRVADYLDAAQASGLHVILQVFDHRLDAANNLVTVDYTAINAICNYVDPDDNVAIKSKPALAGWYTGDEPNHETATAVQGYDAVVAQSEGVYNHIKYTLGSSLPCMMVFCQYYAPEQERFINAYDFAGCDHYPLYFGDPEFGGSTFPSMGQHFGQMLSFTNKNVWYIAQAFGDIPRSGWRWRLPTLREYRYLAFRSILQDLAGYGSWAYPFSKLSRAATDPSYSGNPADPYSNSGTQWLTEVWNPVTGQISPVRRALGAGKIVNAMLDTANYVEAAYKDPSDNNLFALVCRDQTYGVNTPTFTLSTGIPGNLEVFGAARIGETGVRAVGAGAFTDTFSSHQARAYRLKASIALNAGFNSNVSNWFSYDTKVGLTRSTASLTAETTPGCLRVTGRTAATSGVVQSNSTLLQRLRNLGPGNYRMEGYVYPESAGEYVIIEVALKFNGQWNYANRLYQYARGGVWGRREGTLNLQWTATLEDAYISVRTDTTRQNFRVDDLCFWKVP